MNTLKAKSYDSYLSKFFPESVGIAHSVFKRVVVLQINNEMVTIVNPGRGDGPGFIVLSENQLLPPSRCELACHCEKRKRQGNPSGSKTPIKITPTPPALKSCITPGAPVKLTRDFLEIENACRIYLNDASVFDSKITVPSAAVFNPQLFQRNLDFLIDYLGNIPPSPGLIAVIASSDSDEAISSHPLSASEARQTREKPTISKTAAACLDDAYLVASAIRKHVDFEKNGTDLENPRQAARFVRNLMGLGTGLTPTGDDLLLGMTACLNYFSRLQNCPYSPRAEKILSNLKKAIPRYLDKTNFISAQFLKYFLYSRLAGVLRNFLHTLFLENLPDNPAVVDRVLQYGAESGKDVMAGVYLLFFGKLNPFKNTFAV